MHAGSPLFVGADISSGRRPITLAALDGDLDLITLEKWDISTTLSFLQEDQKIVLVINKPSSRTTQNAYLDLRNQITRASFQPLSKGEDQKQWFETNVQDCYREWVGQTPLPRRTLEGRLQRALVLFEQGVRIEDPMEIFEEVTRYKLTKGIFRFENIYSFKELDALAAAFLAWMSFNRPGRIAAQGEFVLPSPS